MKILIIEDHSAIAEIYERILQNNGHETDVAPNSQIALELLSQEKYHLLFVDLMLPGMSGEELIEQIRILEEYIDTPIIVTTNMGSGYDRQRLKELKVREILLKVKAGPKEIIESVNKATRS